MILDNAPCAYKLTEAQYNGARTDGPNDVGATVAERIAAHGWKVVKVADGYVVPLAQPERGLIPLLLDEQGEEEWVSGERVYPTLTGRHNGPLTVSGFACLAGATVNGPVNLRPGATLVATNTTISGPVNAANAAGVFLGDSTVRGPLQVANTNGPVAVIGTKVSGPVNLVNNTGGAAPYCRRQQCQRPAELLRQQPGSDQPRGPQHGQRPPHHPVRGTVTDNCGTVTDN